MGPSPGTNRKFTPENRPILSQAEKIISGWWFQIFLMFTPTWGRFSPILTIIFFQGVGSKPPTRKDQQRAGLGLWYLTPGGSMIFCTLKRETFAVPIRPPTHHKRRREPRLENQMGLLRLVPVALKFKFGELSADGILVVIGELVGGRETRMVLARPCPNKSAALELAAAKVKGVGVLYTHDLGPAKQFTCCLRSRKYWQLQTS